MTENDRAAIQAALARVRSSTPVELPAALDALAAAIPAGPAPVVIEPAPEPELDQTLLANRLLEDLRPALLERAVLELTRWLERQGLQLGPDEQVGLGPAGHITPVAMERVRRELAAAIEDGLVGATGPLAFCPGEREPSWKHQAPRWRVY